MLASYFHSRQIIYGIRTISPEENCPVVRIGVWVKVRVILELGGSQTTARKKSCPRLGLGFGVGLVLWFGGQFSSGAIVLEPQKPWKMRVNKFIFRTFNITKNDFFLAIFQGFYWNISQDLFYRAPPCK